MNHLLVATAMITNRKGRPEAYSTEPFEWYGWAITMWTPTILVFLFDMSEIWPLQHPKNTKRFPSSKMSAQPEISQNPTSN